MRFIPPLLSTLPAALLLYLAPLARADQAMPRTVSTSGEAVVYVTPDEVVVSFGIEVFDENLDKAKAENDRRSETLIKAFRALGVEERQIETDVLQIDIQYSQNRRWEAIGYTSRRAYSVTLKDTKLFEKLVDAGLKNGANQLTGFDFRTTELRKYRDQARTMAIKAAKEKAVALAKDLECGVGKPWQITEGSPSWGDNNLSMNSTQNAQAQARGGEDSGLLPSGQIAIRAVVSVTFDLTEK